MYWSPAWWCQDDFFTGVRRFVIPVYMKFADKEMNRVFHTIALPVGCTSCHTRRSALWKMVSLILKIKATEVKTLRTEKYTHQASKLFTGGVELYLQDAERTEKNWVVGFAQESASRLLFRLQ